MLWQEFQDKRGRGAVRPHSSGSVWRARRGHVADSSPACSLGLGFNSASWYPPFYLYSFSFVTRETQMALVPTRCSGGTLSSSKSHRDGHVLELLSHEVTTDHGDCGQRKCSYERG